MRHALLASKLAFPAQRDMVGETLNLIGELRSLPAVVSPTME